MPNSRARLWQAAGVALSLAVVAACASWQRSARLHPVIYQYDAAGITTTDVWFDADIPKIACMMTHADAGQHRVTSEHPLLPSATFVPAALLRRVTGLAPVAVFRAWSAAVAGLWMVVCFALLYAMTGRLLDAAMFTALGAATSSALFWMSVPEAWVPGSITLLLPFLAAAEAGRSLTRLSRHSILTTVAMSVTVTNVMSAAAAAFATLRFRHAVQAMANAVLVLSVVWAIQAAWFPHSVTFLGSGRVLELIHDDERPAPAAVIGTMLISSIVMPAVEIRQEPDWQGLSVQRSLPGFARWWGAAAALAWLALLLLGWRQLMRQPLLRTWRWMLAVTVAGQLAMHCIIGRETFLYTMHVAPLLVLVSACGCLGRRRTLSLTLAAAVAIAAAVNNWQQFEVSARFTRDLGARTAAAGAVFAAATECR